MAGGWNATQDAFSRLILEIYEAASAPELWPRIMNAIAAGIGAESTHLMVYDSVQQAEILNIFEHGDPDSIKVYMRDYLSIDPRIALRLQTELGAVIADRDIWAAEERLASPVYHDFQIKNGLHDITGAHMSMDNTLVWYGVAKGRPGHFSRDERARLQRVMPHIRQSLRMHLEMQGLADQRDILGSLWSEAGTAIFLLDGRGRLRFANARAEEMIRHQVVSLHAGRLGFRQSRLQAAMDAALREIRSGIVSFDPDPGSPAADAHLIHHPETGQQFGLRMMRRPGCPTSLGMEGEMLQVTLVSLGLADGFTEGELQRFGQLFGLTEAELRVIGTLASAENLEDLALARNIKVDTARKQLKSILAKTGCHSQKEMLRLVERFCFLRMR